MKFCIFLLLFCLQGIPVGAHQKRVDRKPMVEAVYSHMVPMVKLFRFHSKNNKTLQNEEISFLDDVLKLLDKNKIKLNFQYDPKYFDLVEGQAPRIMSTNPYHPESDIYVDLEQLEDPNRREIGLIFVFYLLFHEVAHKTQFADVATRDRIALMFTDFLNSFYHEYPIADDLHILVLSPSADLIDTELVSTSINLAQPTFIILGRREGDITDFTSQVSQQLATMTSNTRGIWDEFQRGMFSVSNELAKFVGHIQSAMESIFEQFESAGLPVENMSEINSVDFNFQELRKLEIHDVKYQELYSGYYVLILNGYYKIESSQKSTGGFLINGLPINQHNEFPVQARILINARGEKGLEIDDFKFSLYQNIDFSINAKVRQVSRSGENVNLKIKVLKKSVIDKEVYLIANYSHGYLSVSPQSIEIEADYKIVSFSIPPYILGSKRHYFVDKIVVSSETAVPLDRIVSLNNVEGVPQGQQSKSASLIKESMGIWGTQNSQKIFRTEFSHLEPVRFFDLSFLNTDQFYLSPNNLNIEFLVFNSPGIREIRLHFSRQILMIKMEPGDPVLDFDKLDDVQRNSMGLGVDTKGLRIAEGGIFSGEKKTRETYVVTHQQIQQTLTDKDHEHRVTAKFQIPFKLSKDKLEANEAYLLPFFTPHSVEVVLADGTTLIHHFSQILDDDKMSCNDVLKFN